MLQSAPAKFNGNSGVFSPRPASDGIYGDGINGSDVINHVSVSPGSFDLFLFDFRLAQNAVLYLWNSVMTNSWTSAFRWYANTSTYDGHIYRGYLVSLNVVDESNTGLTANVGVYDTNGDGAILTSKSSNLPVRSSVITTDSAGKYTGTVGTDEGMPILYARYTRSSEFVSTELTYSPYTMTVREYGYVFQSLPKSWGAQSTESITLFTNSVTVLDKASAGALTNITVVGDGSITIATASKSISQVYDYSQYWSSTISNMASLFAEPMTSTDGTVFTLNGYDLTLSGVDLTGSGTINVGSSAVNLNSGAETTLTLNGGTINIDTVQAYVLSLTTTTVNFTTTGTYDLTGCTITGTVTFTATAAVTVQVAAGIIYDDTDVNVTVVEIGDTPTLTVSADSTTATVRGFTNDSQTTIFSESDGSVDYEYPNTNPIDLDIVEQNYVPINVQNLVPFDGPVSYEMDFDEAYNENHNLNISTDYAYTRTDALTGTLALLTDQSALDIRSALADLIRTNASYYNTKLLLEAIPGLVRIDQLGGLTVTGMDHWKRAGSEVFDAADSSNPTQKWCAVQSVGTITGATTHYRQTSSGTSTAITLTNNVVDEAFQYWSDPNHDGSAADGYDRSGYMLIKSFLAGSKQGRIDVLANAGISALQSTLYVVPLSNAAHDYTGVDPSITGVTLVAGPFTVGTKTFAYKLVDAGTNSGEDIANWINTQAASDPTGTIPGGTGLTWFELPDMVIYNATGVETERGYKEGATPTLVGFYVERGGADHPDFTRFQADDGTYYRPATFANAIVTNMPTDGTRRLQIKNMTTGQIFYSGQPANSTYQEAYLNGDTQGRLLIDGTFRLNINAAGDDLVVGAPTITAGDSVRIRFAEMNGTTSFKMMQTFVTASSTGFAVDASSFIETVPVYATWAALEGQDGAYFDDRFSPNYVLNYVVLDTNIDYSGKSAGLYYCYLLTTEEGIDSFWDGFDLIDAGNLMNNDDVVDVYFYCPSGFVKQTDNVRIFKKTDSSIRPAVDDSELGGLEINWRLPVNVVQVAGSYAITGNINDVAAQVQAGMTSQGYTAGRAGNLDTITTLDNNLDTALVKITDIHNADGLDAADPITISGDGETSSTITTTRLAKTITPTSIERSA